MWSTQACSPATVERAMGIDRQVALNRVGMGCAGRAPLRTLVIWNDGKR